MVCLNIFFYIGEPLVIIDMILVKKYSRLSDSRKNIIKNLFWAILGKVVNVLGALFVGILVARYLGPSQYGLMNYVTLSGNPLMK